MFQISQLRPKDRPFFRYLQDSS